MPRMIALITVLTALSICGQPTVERFEVASIKKHMDESAAFSSGLSTRNGRLTAINVTLKRCIMGAYALGPNQISGGPDWLESERFDIAAKADRPVGDAVMMTMMQGLLAERFKLVFHRETRQVQAYVLEIAKNGPKLVAGDGGASTTSNGRGDIVAANATMDRFAEILSRQTDLPVVNATRLNGSFNLSLKWSLETSKSPNDLLSEGPSLFAALHEQLGLRLRARKVPFKKLIIDHAEKPVAD